MINTIPLLSLILGAALVYFFSSKKAKELKEQLSKLETSKELLEKKIEENNQTILESREQKAQYEAIQKQFSDYKAEYSGEKKKLLDDQTKLNDLVLQKSGEISSLKMSKEKTEEAFLELKDKFREFELNKRSLQEEKEKLQKELAALTQKEPLRVEEHQRHLEKLATTIDSYNLLREKIAKEKEDEKIRELEKMKFTWSIHEDAVKEKMQYACSFLGVEYVDNFPYKGKPDNVVKICDEFIIFDAKSPQSDDLSNFPSYIKSQADLVGKYTDNKTDVKKDVFLVVPSNAIHVIKETYIQIGDRHVHVITPDALAPVLRQLKKIESYTIVENLGPEDREKIVSVIGKMAYGIKRKIQVDQFFSTEFIEVLTGAQNLPKEILDEARLVEKSCKLNPPLSKGKKEIPLESLKDESHKMAGMIAGQGIEAKTDFED